MAPPLEAPTARSGGRDTAFRCVLSSIWLCLVAQISLGIFYRPACPLPVPDQGRRTLESNMQSEPPRFPRRPRRLAGTVSRAAAVLALSLPGAFAGTSAAAPQAAREAPVIHFTASGPFAFASARITVDARLPEGARLGVTLTPPSGGEPEPLAGPRRTPFLVDRPARRGRRLARRSGGERSGTARDRERHRRARGGGAGLFRDGPRARAADPLPDRRVGRQRFATPRR